MRSGAASELDASEEWSVDRRFPWVALFGWIALPLSLFYTFVVPPFQVPDEPNHLRRAEQLLHGDLLGQVQGETAGGMVDSGLNQLVLDYTPPLATQQSKQRAGQIRFSHQREYEYFPNTIRYPPILYVPQMLGLGVGKGLDLSVLHSFYLARLLNALLMLGLAGWALHLCRRGRGVVWLTLLLPMSLFEFGSVSQDAGLVAIGALVAALASRGSHLSTSQYGHLAIGITVLALGRPPLVGLLLLLWLPVFSARVGWPRRVITTGLSLACMLAWLALTMPIRGRMREDVPMSIGPQLSFVIEHPAVFLHVCRETIAADWGRWLRMTVGILGWLNVGLSPATYACASLGCLLMLISVLPQAGRFTIADRVVALIAVCGSCFVMMVASYLTWTPVGSPRIEGMQGRYFLSLLPVLGMIMPHVRLAARVINERRARWLYSLAIGLMLIVEASAVFAVWFQYHSNWVWFEYGSSQTQPVVRRPAERSGPAAAPHPTPYPDPWHCGVSANHPGP